MDSNKQEGIYESIWRAVASLEKQHYTRNEIASALRDVATTIEVEPSDT